MKKNVNSYNEMVPSALFTPEFIQWSAVSTGPLKFDIEDRVRLGRLRADCHMTKWTFRRLCCGFVVVYRRRSLRVISDLDTFQHFAVDRDSTQCSWNNGTLCQIVCICQVPLILRAPYVITGRYTGINKINNLAALRLLVASLTAVSVTSFWISAKSIDRNC